MLFPTRYEACSYVILEALACATPVVTTRVGWTRTLLDELPHYEELCVLPEVNDIAAGLRRVANTDTRELMREVRDYICENNSLTRFRSDWLETIEQVTAPQLRRM